jgi:hypothetical protein
MKTIEEGVGAHSFTHNTLGVRRACWSFGIETKKMTSVSIIHINIHKPNKKLINA